MGGVGPHVGPRSRPTPSRRPQAHLSPLVREMSHAANHGGVRLLAADDAEILEAARVLVSGGLVAFPTETVYGLGALAADEEAVGRIFAAKGRPRHHPLIVHLADTSLLDEWAARVPDAARQLAQAFWPGPLTLVLPRATRVPDAVTGGRPTVGLRVPDQPVAARLLDAVGDGVAAPSANRFGRVSPTTAGDAATELGDRVEVVLDGGPCRVGVESTIVEVVDDRPVLLRVGGLPVERIEAVLGAAVVTGVHGPARAPGMLRSHYAPEARVLPVEAGDAVITAERLASDGTRVALLVQQPPEQAVRGGVILLDPVGDDEAYARHLYRRLREADAIGADVLVAALPSEGGLGRAVRDRLTRAAG
jgi:L-threonylcarbamoyladenylate synthase